MNKEIKNKEIISLDEFDISLHQMIPAGNGRAIQQLKCIIDSIHNSPVKSRRPLSILISGNQGCLTLARSFIRALGLEFAIELPAFLLQPPGEIYNFFNPLFPTDAFIVSKMNKTTNNILKTLYEIITRGEYTVNSSIKKEVIAMKKPVVITAFNINSFPEFFLEEVGHIVRVENYTPQQLELVVLQRLKYSNVGYENEKVLKIIVGFANGDLQGIVRLLKNSIMVMLADGRRKLMERDVKKAGRYC